VTDIIISGLTCQIGPDFYPCIHACDITIDSKIYNLNDFILSTNTQPKIIKKPGYFTANWGVCRKKLQHYKIIDEINYDLFVFELINIDLEKNYLALDKIVYNNEILKNVLDT